MPLDITTLKGNELAQLAKEKWSPYMRAKYENDAKGVKTLVCPFGCGIEDHDAQNNCRHMIGYTKDKRRYEPLVRLPNGRRQVRTRQRPLSPDVKLVQCEKCKRQIWSVHVSGVVCAPCGERLREGDPSYIVQEEVAMAPVLEKVLAEDQLIQITDSWRVYRSDDAQKEAAQKAKRKNDPRTTGLEQSPEVTAPIKADEALIAQE